MRIDANDSSLKNSIPFREKQIYKNLAESLLTKDTHYKLIADEEELKWFFYNVLPPLSSQEVYFISLSARKKLLTEEEQKELALGRTEMFARSVIRERSWDRFLRTIRKYECSYGGYTTKNGSAIPQHSMICYININPSNTLIAHKEFNKQMNEYMFELAKCSAEGRDTTNILYRIGKMDVLLMNCFQKARGTKYYIDIDCDVPKEDEKIIEILNSKIHTIFLRNGNAFLIDTRGGYHLLISRDTVFDKDFNPDVIVKELREEISSHLSNDIDDLGYEIMVNSNEMCPVPGTTQGGHKVTIINKGDYYG